MELITESFTEHQALGQRGVRPGAEAPAQMVIGGVCTCCEGCSTCSSCAAVTTAPQSR